MILATKVFVSVDSTRRGRNLEYPTSTFLLRYLSFFSYIIRLSFFTCIAGLTLLEIVIKFKRWFIMKPRYKTSPSSYFIVFNLKFNIFHSFETSYSFSFNNRLCYNHQRKKTIMFAFSGKSYLKTSSYITLHN